MNALIKREADTLYRSDFGFCSENYKFTVDWLNVRLDCDDLWGLVNRLIDFLPELSIEDFCIRPNGGVCFYQNALYVPKCGHSSFTLNYMLDDNGSIINQASGRGNLYGILLSISGDGCRFINSLHNDAFKDFLEAIRFYNPHCSRIDVACDILDSNNLIVPMFEEFYRTCYEEDLSKVNVYYNCGLHRKTLTNKTWATINPVYDRLLGKHTFNFTIGGRGCKRGAVQLYNKRVEIEQGRLSSLKSELKEAYGNPDYWYRLEYRCSSNADAVFQQLMNDYDIYAAFFQAAVSWGSFVKPKYSRLSDISYSDVIPVWQDFLDFLTFMVGGTIHLVQLVSTPYVPSSVAKVIGYQYEDISKNFAKALMIAVSDVRRFSSALMKGLNLLYADNKEKAFLNDFRLKYGFSPGSPEEAYSMVISQFIYR